MHIHIALESSPARIAIKLKPEFGKEQREAFRKKFSKLMKELAKLPSERRTGFIEEFSVDMAKSAYYDVLRMFSFLRALPTMASTAVRHNDYAHRPCTEGHRAIEEARIFPCLVSQRTEGQ